MHVCRPEAVGQPARSAAAGNEPIGPGVVSERLDGRFRAHGSTSFKAVMTRTELPPERAALELERAFARITGRPAPRRLVALLWAQWALETGRGRSMHANNFGNIKGVGPGGRSVTLSTTEGYGAAERRVTQRFRAYETPEEGALDYVRLLDERYPAALAAAERGDVHGFVDALERGGYFTADPLAYRAAVTTLSQQFDRFGPFGSGPVPQVIAPQSAIDAVLHAFRRASEHCGD